jgi:glycosyltransferase involved in cell wall biosynthesis
MKIAYILLPTAVISGNSNGIKSQALTWKEALEIRGHEIIEINPWDHYDWKKFDIIHLFGTGMWLFPFVNGLTPKNDRIVVSPIIDTTTNPILYRLSTYLGFKKLRLWSPTFTLKQTIPLIRGIFVRSKYESNYINCEKSKIVEMPLCHNIQTEEIGGQKKEPFCLHISSLHHERKNVFRLIRAAKKYGFKLVLAGSTGTSKQKEAILKEIGDFENITVLGFISNEKKNELYAKAKVFALPSLNEGVGIVALDAAAMGCEIVLTNIGGPKEYYNNLAELVDPFNIDSIGKAIMKLMTNEISHQPELSQYIDSNYSLGAIGKNLEQKYLELI